MPELYILSESQLTFLALNMSIESFIVISSRTQRLSVKQDISRSALPTVLVLLLSSKSDSRCEMKGWALRTLLSLLW